MNAKTSRGVATAASTRSPSSAPRGGSTNTNRVANRQREARQSDDEEGRAPAERLPDEAAEHESRHDADVAADVVERERRRALLGREIIREQRMRSGVERRLPDPDPDARQRQLDEAPREAARRRHHAPDRDADDDHVAANASIGEAGDGNRGDGVEEREGEARQQPHLRVGGAEVVLDRLEQDREDLPVDVVDDVEQNEEGEHEMRAGRAVRHGASLARRAPAPARFPSPCAGFPRGMVRSSDA